MFACLIRRCLKQLLVRNIDPNAKPHHITAVFGQIGTIKDFDMPYDSKNSCHQGYAYIEYSDTKYYNEAIRNFHNQKIFANYVKVLIVQDDKEGVDLKKYEFPTRTDYVNHSYQKEKILDLCADEEDREVEEEE
ncbi:hypothetical protein SteCoe_16293 [Stentor coeruleus]|uniref:RRM domain-containing protein n=1 Tax=Stentor coeruleus TaxID=5963 RepID=A0A1R2C1N8_9CILI|nr:hypothetical protein SteCoe_16293 [Stentor coeruleus]